MLRSWMYRTSLKKRTWIAFTGLTVFCIALTGLCAYYVAARAMEKNAVTLNRNVLDQSVNVLDQKLKQIIVASSTMMLGDAYQQTMRDIQAGRQERYFVNLSALQAPFSQATLTETSIESMLLSTPAGDFFPTGSQRRTRVPFQDTSLYSGFKENPEMNWVGSHRDELFSRGNSVVTLLLQPLSDYYVPDVFLIVNVSEDALEETVAAVNGGDGSTRFMLINREGGSVFGDADRPEWSRSPEFLEALFNGDESNFEYAAAEGPMLIGYSASVFAENWLLVSYLSKKQLLMPVVSMQWLVLAIMAGCIVLAVLLARYLSGLLLGPLLKLQRTMARVGQEDLNARFQSPFQDEIGEAGRKFNQMLERIGDLIEEVKDTEQDKRKAEIKALQAQIDPHFLYNTLNTIVWKCEMDEYEDVKEMVISLSALFRLGLNAGQEMTTLGRELDHVRQYLNLQQQCYEGRFIYTINAPPELQELPVLKVILQPLAENSILHGLKERRSGGTIAVTAWTEAGSLLLRVTDNGSGMDAERMNQELSAPGTHGGYALPNIRGRLSLYYGQEANLSFHSEPHAETSATISIPLEGGAFLESKPAD